MKQIRIDTKLNEALEILDEQKWNIIKEDWNETLEIFTMKELISLNDEDLKINLTETKKRVVGGYLLQLLNSEYEKLTTKKQSEEKLIKTKIIGIDQIEMMLNDQMTDYNFHLSGRYPFPRLREYLVENQEKYKEVTNLNISGCNLSFPQNLLFLKNEILPLLPLCKYVDLSFNRYDRESWSLIKQILKTNNIQYINICGNPIASLSSRRELSNLEENQLKKLIWIFSNWVESGNWKNCLENFKNHELIEITHSEFYKNY